VNTDCDTCFYSHVTTTHSSCGNCNAYDKWVPLGVGDAAPELYKALKRLAEYGNIFRYRTWERNPYEQAMEALAKAEGGESE
jgi:hypothetical protein